MDPISWTTYLVTTSLNFGIQFMFYLSLVGTLMIPMVIYLAAKGRSIGVRRGYVKILLAVFDVSENRSFVLTDGTKENLVWSKVNPDWVYPAPPREECQGLPILMQIYFKRRTHAVHHHACMALSDTL